MDEKYFPEKIEEKWQLRWAQARAFEVDEQSEKPSFYCLEMLPYPSGFLHMGHVRNYSIGDAFSWYKRLRGFNVLHSLGWDSFGQPAEQAAIKRGVHPREWTEKNIAYMRGQFKRLGISYDWRREVAAHTPEYYKWDQWFFLKMYERGLVYKRNSPVNWCPNEETVLSNEQSANGICWRCGAAVIRKNLEQWFIRTTEYAAQLLDDMNEIESGWPSSVLTRQRNWIGRSVGTFIDFKLQDLEAEIRIFTTRIDTTYGATALVLAAEHPLIKQIMEDRILKGALKDDVLQFVELVREEHNKPIDPTSRENREDAEKTGINTGFLAINPFSGELISVWIGNYVLMEYGTGAVMCVPAHDERDFEFAKKYSLPLRSVIAPLTHEQDSEIRGATGPE
ncbi:MAG: class I tRNA ligase family protein, partial [Pyrinomonadaceae bacterium]